MTLYSKLEVNIAWTVSVYTYLCAFLKGRCVFLNLGLGVTRGAARKLPLA